MTNKQKKAKLHYLGKYIILLALLFKKASKRLKKNKRAFIEKTLKVIKPVLNRKNCFH